MRPTPSFVGSVLLACQLTLALSAAIEIRDFIPDKITPKFFIFSLFAPEGAVWYKGFPSSGLGDLLAVNISIPGLSMLYPDVHCTADYSVCQVITGESEINAASSASAVVLSPRFDFTETYFMIAGIAGVNPKIATLGSVAFARYSVQVALQYEFDAREMPANFTTGYLGYGVNYPTDYPKEQYGTEVFETNTALQDIAFNFALKGNLSDNPVAAEYRQKYASAGAIYAAATTKPTVVKCDTATSDVYYSGTLLSEAFENTTTLWTNGTGVYCMTAQEDSAILEVMVRGAIFGLVDYSRIILMRTGSDFDRPPPGVTAFDNLRVVDQNGFGIAVSNIFNTGIEVVKGVLGGWDCTYKAGVKPNNYVGDIFGTLGGKPDFGPGSIFGGTAVQPS